MNRNQLTVPWNLSESLSLSEVWRNHLKLGVLSWQLGVTAFFLKSLVQILRFLILEQDRELLGHSRVLEVGPASLKSLQKGGLEYNGRA